MPIEEIIAPSQEELDKNEAFSILDPKSGWEKGHFNLEGIAYYLRKVTDRDITAGVEAVMRSSFDRVGVTGKLGIGFEREGGDLNPKTTIYVCDSGTLHKVWKERSITVNAPLYL